MKLYLSKVQTETLRKLMSENMVARLGAKAAQSRVLVYTTALFEANVIDADHEIEEVDVSGAEGYIILKEDEHETEGRTG